MTAVQYLSAFRVYGADVLLLALGVTIVTSLLKKTLLKNCTKKAYVPLPFLIGLIFYGSYRAIVTRSALPFTAELAATLEGGFACGCAATLYYVFYEQFFRDKKPVPPVAALLAGYVPEWRIPELAELLTAGGKGKETEELFRFVEETLIPYLDPPLGEEELFCLSGLITRFLEETE